LHPAIGAEKGTPHALTWYIVTMGHTTSSGVKPRQDALSDDRAWSMVDRWV
jgi:hypothetical protein